MSNLTTPSPSPDRWRHLRVAFGATAALVLGGCASMQDIPPGTPLAEVQARHGAPTLSCPLPDGSRNLVWSSQPMGQYAWSTQVTPDGKVGVIEQILTDAAFRRVETGVWDEDRLRCTFGPPADISTVGMPSVRQTVWSYRYRQDGVWNSLMYVYLSDDGIVQRLHPGPDPLYETREWPFFF